MPARPTGRGYRGPDPGRPGAMVGERDGVIVTELYDFPLLKAVSYWTISGCLPDCLALDERISEWAIEQGCSMAMAAGRKGWGRAGAPYGWRLRGYQFCKPLVGTAR